MKQFIHDIIFILVLTILIGELICRIFSLKSEIIDVTNYENATITYYTPNSSGINVFGKFPSVYWKKYNINDIGFNTLLDYKDFDSKKINIAFLGDSYVEGFNVDYNQNFSSLLINRSVKIQSYDFGISSFNALNFLEVYNHFEMEKFQYVFVVLGLNDMMNSHPYRPPTSKRGFVKNIYSSSYLINYLNKTHALFKSFTDIFRGKHHSIDSTSKKITINPKVRELFKKQNIFIIPKNDSSSVFLKSIGIENVIDIEHKIQPIDFGTFDAHWNENGRENLINSILPYICLKP